MKTKRTLAITALLVMLIALTTLGIFRGVSQVHARVETPAAVIPTDPTPTPTPCLDGLVCYHVKPSDTDGNPDGDRDDDCPEAREAVATGIGCDNRFGEDAINIEHYL